MSSHCIPPYSTGHRKTEMKELLKTVHPKPVTGGKDDGTGRKRFSNTLKPVADG